MNVRAATFRINGGDAAVVSNASLAGQAKPQFFQSCPGPEPVRSEQDRRSGRRADGNRLPPAPARP